MRKIEIAGFEMPIGAGDHRGDDQSDDERKKPEHGACLSPASKMRRTNNKQHRNIGTINWNNKTPCAM
jgi:hypothetical protein